MDGTTCVQESNRASKYVRRRQLRRRSHVRLLRLAALSAGGLPLCIAHGSTLACAQDREKAWTEINRDYVGPAKELASTAAKYANAAAEVASESTGGVGLPAVPKVNLDITNMIGSVKSTNV